MAVIQLLPGGAGGVNFNGRLIAPVNNRLLALVSVEDHISLTIEGYIVAHPYLYTDFRDKTGASFNSATEVVEYIQYNFLQGPAAQNSRNLSSPSVLLLKALLKQHGPMWPLPGATYLSIVQEAVLRMP